MALDTLDTLGIVDTPGALDILGALEILNEVNVESLTNSSIGGIGASFLDMCVITHICLSQQFNRRGVGLGIILH